MFFLRGLFVPVLCCVVATVAWAGGPSYYLGTITEAVVDTIPVKDNYGDHVTDPNRNPFDITPAVVEQKVEYDPKTNRYVVFEKIGDEYFRTPTYLTFEEYLDYKKKEQERNYFSQMAGLSTGKRKKLNLIDPMTKIDMGTSLIDRLFGGTEVNIQPQGNVDITLGVDHQKLDQINSGLNPNTRQTLMDFDMDIRMNVDGNIGEKMNLGFNFDTQSTFDFDQKIKLEYNSDAFSEDDIIKKVEAGNVSLPLRGNLIQGAQSLFGLKTELQFGHLTLTAIASQQRSQQNNIQVQNGTQLQELLLYPDDYDENRHFFLDHFNRETYESNLEQIPFIATSYRINRIEVWISDDRIDQQRNSRPIVAVSDFGVPVDSNRTTQGNPRWAPSPVLPAIYRDLAGNPLPDNNVNPLYRGITDNEAAYDRTQATRILSSQYGLVESRDFETFQGRLLSPGEFTYHPELGTISLKQRLRTNQVLGVAYEYFYTANCDEVYQVGQLSDGQTTNVTAGATDTIEPPKVTFVKLLKTTQQNPNEPSWDLMMKNVYNMRTSQLTPQDFEFDIFWQDDRDGSLKKYIETNGSYTDPLLQVFGLDRLNAFGDPQPDGVFDFVDGITLNQQTGSIIFPRLEPFGEVLRDTLIAAGLSPRDADSLSYSELYTNTVTSARNDFLGKNKFTMIARVNTANTGVINLGPFVPEGGVRVTAGGRQLVEGVDYEIDYNLGRLNIINDAYLQDGVPINVSYEDNAVFSLQQKNMMGLRADYDFGEKLQVGATYLRLQERPFTQKVNIGDDPIRNQVIGMDLTYSTETPWMTKAVDKLPFYSTKEQSSLNFTGEVAALIPGTNDIINAPGEDKPVMSIDDFEGAVSGFLLGNAQNNTWTLASTPKDPLFPEHALDNDLAYNYNRAKLAWYQLERGNRTQADRGNSYTRQIVQDELFPNRALPVGDNTLYTFDLSYYPDERGPYNYEPPEGSAYSQGLELIDGEIKLKEPKSRWGGIMRYFNNPDFEAANYQFIEFWMLDPFGERPDPSENPEGNERGEIVFQLGNVSEDILKDGSQFFENAINVDTSINIPPITTIWGIVPFTVPVADGFDFSQGEQQDVGLDGLSSSQEATKFQSYITALTSAFGINAVNLDEFRDDPSGDDFVYFDDPNAFDLERESLLERYKNFNNPEGNAPLNQEANQNQGFTQRRGNPRPEKEDLNNNRSLQTSENFYEYRVNIENAGGRLDETASPFIVESRDVDYNFDGGNRRETWYRVRVPIRDDLSRRTVGSIDGFRSIQFMRMYMTGFEKPKTFRMAEFELVRSQWFTQEPSCAGTIDAGAQAIEFNVDERGIEENSAKSPFAYVLPERIVREEIQNTFQNLRQDENSLALNFSNLQDSCQVAIHKVTELDLTFYEEMELFVHLEATKNGREVTEEDIGDLAVFVRLGKDFEQNYYEYELPLTPSQLLLLPTGDQNAQTVWPDTNVVNFNFEEMTDLKKERAAQNGTFNEEFIRDLGPGKAKFKLKGNPSIGFIKMMQIGVRNIGTGSYVGEVWVNELRVKGLLNKGGVAAQARMQMKMADLGEINLSGEYQSVGWGALDQRVEERSREQILAYDAATNLSLGKFFPSKWGVQLPFYAQYSQRISTPLFDPLQQDLTVREAEEITPNEPVRERAQTRETIKAFNFTNVRAAPTKGGDSKKKKKRRVYSPENISVTYAYSETDKSSPIIEQDNVTQYTGSVDYQYSSRPKYIKPFKFIKPKALEIISDANINLLPNAVSFSSSLHRQQGFRTFRFPDGIDEPTFRFDDKRFTWEREYGLKWDLTTNLKFNFDARANSIIDELRQTGLTVDPEDRQWVDQFGSTTNESGETYQRADADDYWQENFQSLGRNQGYRHNVVLNYTIPTKKIPILDWVNVKADYKSNYQWDAASLIVIDEVDNGPGNVISNGQDRSLNATLSFDKLYRKSKYLEKIEKGNRVKPTRTKRSRRARVGTKDGGKEVQGENDKLKLDSKAEVAGEGEGGKKKKEKKKREGPSKVERILIRPLLALRSAKLTYRESLGSVIPGFEVAPQYLGLGEGFGAPGWQYVAGLQPNIDMSDERNFLRNAADNNWLNSSRVFNSEVSLNEQHNLDMKVILEPFEDFKIDINLTKRYQLSHREVFKNKTGSGAPGDPDNSFIQTAMYENGSFEASYVGFNTLFGDNYETYLTFLDNRQQVSQELGVVGLAHENPSYEGYTQGFGPNNPDVAIPAFLYAYEGRAVDETVDANQLQETMSNRTFIPKPNWQLTYDGLSKLKPFKGWLQTFSLKHGYRSTIQVNNFNTTARFDASQEYLSQTINVDNGNYYSRVLIPALTIRESFQPLIGISLKTKSELNVDFEFSKSRDLDLRLTAEELNENLATEFSFGLGYTIKNFKGFGKQKKSRGKTRTKKEQKGNADKSANRRGRVNNNRGKNITFNCDVSYRDDVQQVYQLATGGQPLPSRGTELLQINPNIEYVYTDNLTFRFFFDYSRRQPKVSTAVGVTQINSGLTLRFTLN
jgi:cell surface protein SprA